MIERAFLCTFAHFRVKQSFQFIAGTSLLLFFAAYVICRKNYSFSRVVFLFLDQNCQLFSFKNKWQDNSKVRTTRFSSIRFEVQVTIVPNIFTIYPQHFLMPEISEALQGSPTKFFGTVRQKNFDGKSWYSPPLTHKLFRYRKLSETAQKGSLRNFLALWDKKNFDGKSWYPPPLLHINFFATGNFLKHSTEGFPTKFCGTVRQKIFDRKSWCSPLSYP